MAPSPSRKHPRSEDSVASPPKRRRTALHNPIPQNYRVPADPQGSQNAPSTPGTQPAGSNRPRLVERSFAPKPLLSPFAAHLLKKSRENFESGLRHSASLPSPGNPSNTAVSRQSSAAADSAAMPPPPLPRPRSIFSGAVSTLARAPPVRVPPARVPPAWVPPARVPPAGVPPARVPPARVPSAKVSPAGVPPARVPPAGVPPVGVPPTPARRFHDPSRTYSSADPRSSFFAFLNETPASSASSQNSPIASHVLSPASPASGMARADDILNTIHNSIAKAKGHLAANRADHLEEAKQKQREAARKKYEEEERIKRDDIFRQLRESDEMYQRAEKAKRDFLIQQGGGSMEGGILRSSREERASYEKALEVPGSGELNGGPSFVTESTVLDSLNYADQVGSDEDADATQANLLASRPRSPRLRFRESDMKREAEARASKAPVICLDSDDDSEPENLRPPPFLRSQKDDPEPGNLRPPPFTHSRKEAQAIDADEENAFGDAEDDYTEDDEAEGLNERAQSEEAGLTGDSEGTGSPAGELEAPAVVDLGDAEEIIDYFPESTVWSDGNDGDGDDGCTSSELIEYDTLLAEDFEEYEEEKTEKDDSDTERAFTWGTEKTAMGQDFDQSLGSTVLVPSQPTSFMDTKAATFGSDSSSQKTPVPDMHVTSPIQPREQGGPGRLALDSITEGTGSRESPVSIASSPRDSPANDSIADGGYGAEPDIQHEETAASPDHGHMGLVINGKDVYNRHQCHIGTVDEYCYVYADKDDSAVGRVDDHHSFYPIVHGGARGRGFSSEELDRKPAERLEMEYEFDKAKVGSDARVENGNGDEDEEVDLMEQDGDNDEAMSDEGEEQTGLDLDGDHDGVNMDTGDTEVSPASVGNDPFFHFSYNTSQSQPPTQTEPRFFTKSEIPIDPDLAMPEAPTLGEETSPVVKDAEPSITPEVIADSLRHVEEEPLVVEDAKLSITPEVTADSPQQVEEVSSVVEDAELSITPEVTADSPEQVEEVSSVVEDAEFSITTEVIADSPQQAEEISLVVEDAELSITTEVIADSPQQPEEGLLGAPSEVSIKIEEGDDKDHEEQQEGTLAPFLLPDSIEDRNSMVGEVGSEGSVEVVEWDQQSFGEEGSGELSDSGSEAAEPGKAGEKMEHQIDRLESSIKLELEAGVEATAAETPGDLFESSESPIKPEAEDQPAMEGIPEYSTDHSESLIKLELEAGVQPVTEPTPGYLFEHSESLVKPEAGDQPAMEGIPENLTGHSESLIKLELEAGVQPATGPTPGYLFGHSESLVKLESGVQPTAEAAPVDQYEHSESPAEFELEPVVQADTEDAINSDPEIPDRLSGGPAPQTELGSQCDEPANVADEDKELRRVSGIEVVVDQLRQITPISASPTMFSPQVEASSRKRKFQPDSPPSEASQPVIQVEPAHSGEDQMDIDREGIAPTTKKRRTKAKAKPKKKKQADKPYVPPKEETEPEDEQDPEPKAKRRRKSKAKITTEDVMATAEGHEAYSGGEKKLEVIALDEAGVSTGKELRGGGNVEPGFPVIAPSKRAAPRRGQSAEPKVLHSREGSEAPEYRTLRNRTVVTNRGRSASVEVSTAETDPGKTELRRSTRASSKVSVPESPKKSPLKKTMRAKGSAGPAAGVRKGRGKTPLSSIKEVAGEESPKKVRVPRKK